MAWSYEKLWKRIEEYGINKSKLRDEAGFRSATLLQMAVLTERLGRIRGPACAIPGGPGKRSKKAGRQTGWLLDTF